MITNRHTDPRLRRSVPGGWNSTRERINGHVRVTPNAQVGTDFIRGTVYLSPGTPAGMIVAITVTNDDGVFDPGNYLQSSNSSTNQYVAHDDTTRTYWMRNDNDNGNPALWVHAYPVTILGVAVYAPDDWDKALTLSQSLDMMPVFCGETEPGGRNFYASHPRVQLEVVA